MTETFHGFWRGVVVRFTVAVRVPTRYPVENLVPNQPTAIVAVIAAAEPIVSRWREQHDPAAQEGMPAHVTILWPFVMPSRLSTSIVERLAEVVSEEPAFSVSFPDLRWFGDDVLYLAPDPAKPFVRLTKAVAAAFPEFPPYGGDYSDVVPHLTVGHSSTRGLLRQAATAIERAPTITTTVAALHICERRGTASSWRMVQRLPLGPLRRPVLGPSRT